MEPTVFCLVVPMIINICSDPMLVREKRSIVINTGNESAGSSGELVNTILNDKQLIINIETKVLPQFNVYLDSLAHSPRMQCMTNDENINNDIKKRIFTCIPLPVSCCPSPLTCTCSEKSIDPTTVYPPRMTTALPNCLHICLHCSVKSTHSVTPTQLAYPVTTALQQLTTSQNQICKGVCEFCVSTTPILPTPEPQTTAATSPLVPNSSRCKSLCLQCALKPTTTMTPQTTQIIDNCLSICTHCQRNALQKLSTPISSTAVATTIPASSAPDSENCQQVCSSCLPYSTPTKSDQCRDICSKCTSTTAIIVPGTPSCETLCQSCKSSLVQKSVQCSDVCKNCKTPSKLNCAELCNKCKPKPTSHPPYCRHICDNCQPVLVSPAQQEKCISCKILCKMCGFQRHYRKVKRDIHFEAEEESLPLVVNIERVKSSDDPCETTIVQPLSGYNSGFRYKDLSDTTLANFKKCRNFQKSYKSKDDTCLDCYINKFALSSENVPTIDSKMCPELCKKCSWEKTLKPGSKSCFNVCKYCHNKGKARPPAPNVNNCIYLCNQCINITGTEIVPDPLKPCKVYCQFCQEGNKHNSSTTGITVKDKPNLLSKNKSNIPIPNINNCLSLCKQCMNSTGGSALKPDSKACKVNCQLCRRGRKEVSSPAGLPDSCEQHCAYCKQLVIPTLRPASTPSPRSTECDNICSQCKRASEEKHLKITRTNCTHNNN